MPLLIVLVGVFLTLAPHLLMCAAVSSDDRNFNGALEGVSRVSIGWSCSTTSSTCAPRERPP